MKHEGIASRSEKAWENVQVWSCRTKWPKIYNDYIRARICRCNSLGCMTLAAFMRAVIAYIAIAQHSEIQSIKSFGALVCKTTHEIMKRKSPQMLGWFVVSCACVEEMSRTNVFCTFLRPDVFVVLPMRMLKSPLVAVMWPTNEIVQTAKKNTISKGLWKKQWKTTKTPDRILSI